MSGILNKLKNKKPTMYVDFDASFNVNPITGDIVTISDEKAVSQSLKFLILTNTGERLFQPTLGGDIHRTLFRTITPSTMTFIKEKIKDIIVNHEPRVSLIDVDVVAYDHTVKITIYYNLRNREDTLQTTVFIERDR